MSVSQKAHLRRAVLAATMLAPRVRQFLLSHLRKNCAACHQEQISSASLNLITVPEFEANLFDPEVVEELCGIETNDEEYESVSTESLNSILAALSETDPESTEEIQEKIGSANRCRRKWGLANPQLLSEAGASSQRLLAGFKLRSR